MRANEFLTEVGFWDTIKQAAKEFTLGAASETGTWLTDRDKEALQKASPGAAANGIAKVLFRIYKETDKKLKAIADRRGIDLTSDTGRELYMREIDTALIAGIEATGVDVNRGRIGKIIDNLFDRLFHSAGSVLNISDGDIKNALYEIAKEAIKEKGLGGTNGKKVTVNAMFLKDPTSEKIYIPGPADKRGRRLWKGYHRSPLGDKFEEVDVSGPADQKKIEAVHQRNPALLKKMDLIQFQDGSLTLPGGA